MDRQYFKRSGLSIIELVIGTVVLALISLATSQIWTGLQLTQKGTSSKAAVEQTVISLFDHILKVGRSAGAQPNPGPRACSNSINSLRCPVDFNSPPTGVTKDMRFRFDAANSQVLYEELTNPAPETWALLAQYPNITGFVICGDTEMTAGTCPLTPNNISQRHTNDLGTGTPANRFFRFQIQGGVPAAPNIQQTFQGSFVIQSAFFTRNPPFAGDPNVVYQYGTK
jgi:type II secretory pathway pseudopilin PulG